MQALTKMLAGDLMCTQTAFVTWPRVVLPLMPVIAERAAETVTGLKRPRAKDK